MKDPIEWPALPGCSLIYAPAKRRAILGPGVEGFAGHVRDRWDKAVNALVPASAIRTRRQGGIFLRLLCTLTKGGTRALRDLDLFRPSHDAFATTLTSLDDNFSLKFERNAPLPGDRIAAAKAFYERGVYVWDSLEPTLDIEASLAIIRATHGFTNLFKIGRANYCGALTRTTDWRDYTMRAIDLCQQVGAAHYIKKDLQEFLPPGYHNPMRVPQFHF